MTDFQAPMQPFPGLGRWSRQARLAGSRVSLHFYDTGGEGKKPVLLVHGLGDEADTWRRVIPRLAGDYRAIAPDLPGFGQSEKVRQRYSVPFFVAVLRELLDQLSILRAVVVGHSAGAVIAQELALEHPQRVERLVLIAGTLVARETRLDPALLLFLVPGLGEWSYNRLRKDPQAAYRSLEPYYNRLEDLPADEREFLYRRVNQRVWSAGQRRAFLSTLRNLATWLPAQQKNLPARLRAQPIPTTVLWGEADRVTQPAAARALVDLLPAVRLVMVPGAGHNLQQEQPGVVVEAIG